jgi:hypothetical protein
MMVVSIASTVLYGLHTQQLAPDCLMLMFMAWKLAIATSCVRPTLTDDAETLKREGDRVLRYLVCAERVMVWPVTCTLLVLSDIALGIGGMIQVLLIICVLVFFAAFFMHVKKTLQMLQGEQE